MRRPAAHLKGQIKAKRGVALFCVCAKCRCGREAHVREPSAHAKTSAVTAQPVAALMEMSWSERQKRGGRVGGAVAGAAVAAMQNEHALHLHLWQFVREDAALQDGAHCAPIVHAAATPDTKA